MSRFKVLLTDYAWPDLKIERAILTEIGAELVLPAATDPATLAAAAADVDAIMTNWAKVPRSVLERAEKCRMVARLGVGLDNIDVAYATQRGMLVSNVPDYCLTEVAEHTIALLLALARKVSFYHLETKSGRYDLSAGPILRRVEGQTLGIVGLGNIGRLVAEKAHALGLRVLATGRSKKDAVPFVEWRGFEQLLGESDYVSLHVPLTPGTKNLISSDQLRQMKPSAYLINTARGGLVDHAALASALDANQLAGAALDVQQPEPPDLNQKPFSDPRVIVTPHAAFVSAESLENLRTRAARQVATCLAGGVPENVVNSVVTSQRE